MLAGALSLADDVAAGLTRDTLLFGNLPELDSMVAGRRSPISARKRSNCACAGVPARGTTQG